jgi:hypothetical protein
LSLSVCSANVLCHQAELSCAGALCRVNELCDVVEQEILVRLQKYRTVTPALEYVLKTFDEPGGFNFILIDPNVPVSIHTQNNGCFRFMDQAVLAAGQPLAGL